MSKWGKRIGYGIGDLGCNLVFSTMSSYLLIFYTDVFGIAAAAAGTMMLVTKLVDAITDTIMGVIVDKTHTKWGQGRPYFAIGAVPFAVLTVLTFIVPDLSESGKLIWAYVTYCLLCTAYTVVNIPLNTIVPRLSSDPHERNILVSTRMVCALLGTAIVMSITTPFVKFVSGIVDPGLADPFKSPKAWVIVMGIYGVAAMLIFFLTFACTEEVVPPSVQNEDTSLKENLKALTGQAWLVMIFNFLYFALYVVRSTTVIYFFKYNLGREDLATLVGFLGILSGLPILHGLAAHLFDLPLVAVEEARVFPAHHAHHAPQGQHHGQQAQKAHPPVEHEQQHNGRRRSHHRRCQLWQLVSQQVLGEGGVVVNDLPQPPGLVAAEKAQRQFQNMSNPRVAHIPGGAEGGHMGTHQRREVNGDISHGEPHRHPAPAGQRLGGRNSRITGQGLPGHQPDADIGDEPQHGGNTG